eukprot:TRINITY_DN238_c1_g2_i1.p1 TRINITY_DN238_c1_g2~~TRINITY_DN238_c1_g2_i1.p1  ORF type:complete len:598 (-),score=174.10 TRINITY_DN238_c1_g2_i1:539-2332(-)
MGQKSTKTLVEEEEVEEESLVESEEVQEEEVLGEEAGSWLDDDPEFALDEDNVHALAEEAAKVLAKQTWRQENLVSHLKELQRSRIPGVPEHIDPEWWEGGPNMIKEEEPPMRDPIPALIYQKLWIHDVGMKPEYLLKKADESDQEDEDEEEEEEEKEDDEEKSDVDSVLADEEAEKKKAREEAKREFEASEKQRIAELRNDPKLQGYAVWLTARENRHELCDARRLREKAEYKKRLFPDPVEIPPVEGQNWFKAPEFAGNLAAKVEASWWCWNAEFVSEVLLVAQAHQLRLPVVDLKAAQRAFRKRPELAYAFRRHVEAVSLDGTRQLWSDVFLQLLGTLRAQRMMSHEKKKKKKRKKKDDFEEVRYSEAEVEEETGRKFPAFSDRKLPLFRTRAVNVPPPATVKHADMCRQLLEDAGELPPGPPEVPPLPKVLPYRQGYSNERTKWLTEEQYRRRYGDVKARDLIERERVWIRVDPDVPSGQGMRLQYLAKPDPRDDAWVRFPPGAAQSIQCGGARDIVAAKQPPKRKNKRDSLASESSSGRQHSSVGGTDEDSDNVGSLAEMPAPLRTQPSSATKARSHSNTRPESKRVSFFQG